MYKALLLELFDGNLNLKLLVKEKSFSTDNYDNEMESIEEIYYEVWKFALLFFFFSLSLSR